MVSCAWSTQRGAWQSQLPLSRSCDFCCDLRSFSILISSSECIWDQFKSYGTWIWTQFSIWYPTNIRAGGHCFLCHGHHAHAPFHGLSGLSGHWPWNLFSARPSDHHSGSIVITHPTLLKVLLFVIGLDISGHLPWHCQLGGGFRSLVHSKGSLML